MLDLKAFKVSNIITIIGIYVALLLTVPIQIKQNTAGNSKIFYFQDYISGYGQALSEEEIEAWLCELRKIRQGKNVIHFELKEAEEELIPDETIASVEEKFKQDDIEMVREYLQAGELSCYVEGSMVLTEEQEQLSRICGDFGMTLTMSDPARKKQSDAAKARGKFYKIMFLVAAVCSFLMLFVVEYFWFQSRKQAWRIRRLFCVSRVTLVKETALSQICLLLLTLVAALASMAFLNQFGIWQMLRSTTPVLVSFLVLVSVFCFFSLGD